MDPELIEINLLGTGGGYGESLVIHIGNDEWIVIDSCQNPSTKETLPLSFLKKRSVDLNNVKLVLCTHWHDDHIRGISELLEQTPNAIFSIAKVTDIEKFLLFIELDSEKESISSNSSTLEFKKCLEIIDARNKIIKSSLSDRLLYSTSYNNLPINIYALSPSDLSCKYFDKEISTLLSKFEAPNKKVPYQSINDRSVAILLQLGNHCALLGADLEAKTNKKLGWLDIIYNSQVINSCNKSSYFKIPHHGSVNGFHNGIWQNLLIPKPIATLTPWNRGKKLPQASMVSKYLKLTTELHSTSKISTSNKPKKRRHKIEETIKSFNPTLEEIKFHYGVISSQIRMNDMNHSWKTFYMGTAYQM